MYQTILSKEGFRKGMDLYFKRHDGDAVSCDDFRAAMADANEVDLKQFGLWYSTSGTPTVTYSTEFDPSQGVFKLTLTQSSNSEKPLFIPVSLGLIDKATGDEVVPTKVLEFKEEKQTFEFPGLKGDVVPSILRQFSAPVKLVPSTEMNEESLKFLAAKDTDGFNRWEAGQTLYAALCFQEYKERMSDTTLGYVFEAFEGTLNDDTMDFSIKAYAMTLPTESTLSEEIQEVDPVALRKARGAVKKAIASKFHDQFLKAYNEMTTAIESDGVFKVDAKSIGRRRLRNTLLGYLTTIKESEEEQVAAAKIATSHFENAKCMTDKVSALSTLVSMDGAASSARDKVIQTFHDDAKGDALVLNKWFSVQASADLPDVLDRVKALIKHPDFTLSNPNRCRSVISVFTMNLAPFHAKDGEGYKFIGEMIAELDKRNPQLSSRIGKSMIQWKKYSKDRADMMKAELKKLSEQKLSDDLFEVVNSGLK
jgi:aminopeptidase N